MSLTVLAIGETTGLQIGDFDVGQAIPTDDMRLLVGLKDTTPQHAAGYLASPY